MLNLITRRFDGSSGFFATLGGGGEIGEGELDLDRLDVADGIDRPLNVDNIIVVKTPNNLNNRVRFADVGSN